MRENRDTRSLKIMKEWVQECLNSDYKPLEIYNALIDAVRDNVKYHELCAAESRTLITMLTSKIQEVKSEE